MSLLATVSLQLQFSSVVGAESLDSGDVFHLMRPDILYKKCEYRAAEKDENAGIYRKSTPCEGHVEDKTEKDRRDGLGGHAGGVVVAGELPDLLRGA